MDPGRRAVLSAVGGALLAGCTGSDGGTRGNGASPTQTTGTTPTATGTPPGCDPEDVTRPAKPEGTNIEGREYPRKPRPLTEQAIREYLDEFETAFAWNRVLRTASGTVTSINVDNLEGFPPEAADGGYLASSRMRVSYSTDRGETPTGESSEREYVASYYVSEGPVVRAETDSEAVDPRTRDDARLVQCGADAATK